MARCQAASSSPRTPRGWSAAVDDEQVETTERRHGRSHGRRRGRRSWTGRRARRRAPSWPPPRPVDRRDAPSARPGTLGREDARDRATEPTRATTHERSCATQSQVHRSSLTAAMPRLDPRPPLRSGPFREGVVDAPDSPVAGRERLASGALPAPAAGPAGRASVHAGEHLDDALAASPTFQHQGVSVLLTRLGENLTRIEDADEVAAEYERLIDRIRGTGASMRRALGQAHPAGLRPGPERTFQHVSALAARAAVHGQTFWIDMESSPYTEPPSRSMSA